MLDQFNPVDTHLDSKLMEQWFRQLTGLKRFEDQNNKLDGLKGFKIKPTQTQYNSNILTFFYNKLPDTPNSVYIEDAKNIAIKSLNGYHIKNIVVESVKAFTNEANLPVVSVCINIVSERGPDKSYEKFSLSSN